MKKWAKCCQSSLQCNTENKTHYQSHHRIFWGVKSGGIAPSGLLLRTEHSQIQEINCTPWLGSLKMVTHYFQKVLIGDHSVIHITAWISKRVVWHLIAQRQNNNLFPVSLLCYLWLHNTPPRLSTCKELHTLHTRGQQTLVAMTSQLTSPCSCALD